MGLALYGVWTALYVPPMFIGESSPLLLVCLLCQAVFAIAAAAGVARGAGWAVLLVFLFAASVVATQLIEGFVLQIAPYMRAVVIAVATVVGAFFLATMLRGRGAARVA